MSTPLNHTKLGLLLPAILNPATATAVAVTFVAVGLFRLLSDEEDEEYEEIETVEQMPITPPVRTVTKPLQTDGQNGLGSSKAQENDARREADAVIEPRETEPALISVADKSEMIRNAMSELGKRSAAARAKKKLERSVVG